VLLVEMESAPLPPAGHGALLFVEVAVVRAPLLVALMEEILPWLYDLLWWGILP